MCVCDYDGKRVKDIKMTISRLKEEFPVRWKKALATVRVCDDTNIGNGFFTFVSLDR